jgi:hypothetical protein
MTDPVDRAAVVLRVVADFLKKLPAEQVADLVNGNAKLLLVPPGSRITQGSGHSRPGPSTQMIDVDAVRNELDSMTDRRAAARYVERLGTVPQLRELAAKLGVPSPNKIRKPDLAQLIADGTVGSRLTDQAIRGGS